MKKLLFILSLPLLMSCGERPQRNYKIELMNGEVYHVKSSGYYWYRSSNRVEFNGDKGMFFDVKYIIEESNY